MNLFDLAQALRLIEKQAGSNAGRGVLVITVDCAATPFDALSAALGSLCANVDSSAALRLSDNSAAACAPLAFYLSPSDAASLRDPAVIARIASEAGGAADPLTSEPLVALGSAYAHLAKAGRVTDVSLADASYVGPAAVAAASSSSSARNDAGTIHTRAFARVGLLGNPTDGYGGKTVSVTLSNFVAEAWLTPNGDGSVTLQPHPLYDQGRFTNIRQLSTIATREGYSGGIRLMSATLNRFYQHMAARGVALPLDKGFTLRYHTTIPRQVGLAGSSALVTAMLRALMQFYGECRSPASES